MQRERDQKEFILQGFVIPTDINRHGRPVEICIETDSFERYIVAGGHCANDLYNHLFETITVFASWSGEDADGTPMIHVSRFLLKAEAN